MGEERSKVQWTAEGSYSLKICYSFQRRKIDCVQFPETAVTDAAVVTRYHVHCKFDGSMDAGPAGVDSSGHW